MLGNETELSNAVDRALVQLGEIEETAISPFDPRVAARARQRAAILRHAAFRAAVRKLVGRRRRRKEMFSAAEACASC